MLYRSLPVIIFTYLLTYLLTYWRIAKFRKRKNLAKISWTITIH